MRLWGDPDVRADQPGQLPAEATDAILVGRGRLKPAPDLVEAAGAQVTSQRPQRQSPLHPTDVPGGGASGGRDVMQPPRLGQQQMTAGPHPSGDRLQRGALAGGVMQRLEHERRVDRVAGGQRLHVGHLEPGGRAPAVRALSAQLDIGGHEIDAGDLVAGLGEEQARPARPAADVEDPGPVGETERAEHRLDRRPFDERHLPPAERLGPLGGDERGGAGADLRVLVGVARRAGLRGGHGRQATRALRRRSRPG